MNFVFRNWSKFCKKLNREDKISVTAKEVFNKEVSENYIVLKHDVESKVKKALHIARIEANFSHCGSYYVQAYLLRNKKTSLCLKKFNNSDTK